MSWYRFPNGQRTAPTVTSTWMDPDYDGPHYGTDSINHPGGYNYAVCSGTVVMAGYNPSGAGNEVRVQAEDGNIFRELHFARVDVAVGQRVEMGSILGVQGATGDATGVHCHTEIWPDGLIAARLDPWPYIGARGGPSDPVVLKPNQRTTASWVVAARTMADLKTTPFVALLDPGTVIDCVWWQYGDGGGSGNDVFYLAKFSDGRQFYVHSGDVVQSGVAGVPEYEGQIPKPPVVVPPGVVDPPVIVEPEPDEPTEPDPPVKVPPVVEPAPLWLTLLIGGIVAVLAAIAALLGISPS